MKRAGLQVRFQQREKSLDVLARFIVVLRASMHAFFVQKNLTGRGKQHHGETEGWMLGLNGRHRN